MDETRKNILTKGALAAWGMLTLTLLISFIFLLIEFNNDDGISTAADFQSIARSNVDDLNNKARSVDLFFAHPDIVQLAVEERQLELTGSVTENCKMVIEALIQGPRMQLTPILSPSTRIRGIYLLENGELVIDFSRELEAGHIKSASSEWLMFQGIAHTVTQDALFTASGKSIQSIRFLFEGAPPQSTFPGHINVTMPLTPDTSIKGATSKSANNA